MRILEITKPLVMTSPKYNQPKRAANNGHVNPANDKKVAEYRLSKKPYKL